MQGRRGREYKKSLQKAPTPLPGSGGPRGRPRYRLPKPEVGGKRGGEPPGEPGAVGGEAARPLGLLDTHRREPGSGRRVPGFHPGLPRLASIRLPGQRAGAVIGSQRLPRDLKCNPGPFEPQRDSKAGQRVASVGVAPPASPPGQVSLAFPHPHCCHTVNGDSGREFFGDSQASYDRLGCYQYLRSGFALEPDSVGLCCTEFAISSSGWS